MRNPELVFRDIGQQDYLSTWAAMRAFVDSEVKQDEEVWLLEHPPVYTLGQNGKLEHVLQSGDIPVIQTDRGGQVTYHGPGQLIAYLLLNMRTRGFRIRELVQCLEQVLIDLLAEWEINAHRREGAPGVYVADAKIASLGLRIRNGWSYHGLSLNVNMDLKPFAGINPCGIADLNMTQLVSLGGPDDSIVVKERLASHLAKLLGYEPRFVTGCKSMDGLNEVCYDTTKE